MKIQHHVRMVTLTSAMLLVLPGFAFALSHTAANTALPVSAKIHGAARSGAPPRVPQGYLGIDLRDVGQDEVSSLKLSDTRGAEIVHVDHDGPAGKLGLQRNDVILQMNGVQIQDQEQLRQMLREMPAGKSVTFVISRDGQQQTLTTQLANRQEVERRAWEQHLVVPDPGSDYGPPPQMGSGFVHSDSGNTSLGKGAKAHRDFLGATTVLSASFTGAQLEVMGPQLAEFFGVEGNAGLLVRSVEANSPAEDAGLRAGDVVMQVNQVPVTTASEWSKTIHQNRGRPVALLVLRDRHEQTLTMTPDSKKRSSVAWPFTSTNCPQIAEL
ncbi:PDZ domain-containing protein [Edaphobacter dinghuensis]|nr:PDZ domain-containing protein [Edaphobacter dinghuensis]